MTPHNVTNTIAPSVLSGPSRAPKHGVPSLTHLLSERGLKTHQPLSQEINTLLPQGPEHTIICLAESSRPPPAASQHRPAHNTLGSELPSNLCESTVSLPQTRGVMGKCSGHRAHADSQAHGQGVFTVCNPNSHTAGARCPALCP